jgi:dihydrofolate synthase/folylpolyglutamate synthase
VPQAPPPAITVLAPILPSKGISAADTAKALLADLPPTDELVSAPQRESVLDVVRPWAEDRGARLNEVALCCRLARERSGLDEQQFRLKTDLNEYKLRLALLGAFQIENAATAVLAVERALRVESSETELQPTAVRAALEVVRLPGRAELIKRRPIVIVDSASNAASLRRLIETIQPLVRPGRLRALVDANAWSDIDEAVRVLGPLDPEIIAAGASTVDWGNTCTRAGLAFRSSPDVEAAVESLTESPDADPVVVFGSRSAVAAARAQVLALLPADMRLN